MQSQSQKPLPPDSTPITFRKAFPPSIIGPMFVQIAVVVGGLIVGAVYLGKFLDVQFATRPWLTVVSFLVATFVALPITYNLGMKAINKINQAEMPSKEDVSSASSVQS